jgi:hypothetical protein
MSTDFRVAHVRFQQLAAAFKATPSAGPREGEYRNRLKEAMDRFYDRRRAEARKRAAERNEARRAKEQLILDAKAAEQWADATSAWREMNKLFERWRATGSAGRDHDQRLWASFSGSRNAVRARLPKRTAHALPGPKSRDRPVDQRGHLERRRAGLEATIGRIQWEIAVLDGEIRNIDRALYYAGGSASPSTLRRMNNQILKKQEVKNKKYAKLNGIAYQLDLVNRDLAALA